MNSVKRQFGIILKLAVMLCLIGCFFIGKTSVVKADLAFKNEASTSGNVQVKITGATKDDKYEIYLGDIATAIDTISIGDDGTGVGVEIGKADILAKVAGMTTPALGEININYKKKDTAGSPVATGIKTLAIYKVTATVDGGASASAEVDNVSGSTCYNDKAVYGYVGGSVNIKASNFSGCIFKEWKNTKSATTKNDKEFEYIIADADAASNSIVWTLYTNAAATNITLDTNPSPHTFTITSTNTDFTVGITGGTYDKKKIEWTTDAPSPITVEKQASGDIRVKNWSDTIYGTYTLTATLPDSTPEGNLVKTFTLERVATLKDLVIEGPNTAYVGSNVTYSFKSVSPNQACVTSYKWTITGSGGDIVGSDTGTSVTVSPKAEGTYTIKLTVTNSKGSADASILTTVKDPKISDISISPDGVTAGYTATITATVTPKEGVQQFASGGGAKIESSDTDYFTVESYSVDTANGKISIKVKGIKHDTSKKLKFTYQGDKGVGNTVTEFTFKVYMKPKIEESSGSLKITLPDKVITGCSNDLTEVTGFRLYAYKSDIDSPIYDSGDTYKSAGKSKTLSASDVNQIVKDKSGSFSGEQDTLKFVVVPMGKRSGSDDYHRAKTSDDKVIKSDEVSVNVYRASVSGNGIIGSSAYGIAGQKVSITASPAAGYASIKWSDGSTNPTKEVTLSTSTSANQLKAEGVLGAQNPNAAGGTGGANSGDMSGYDDVPKTAESNSAIWLIVFMVFAVLGIAYALYLQLRASTSNDK